MWIASDTAYINVDNLVALRTVAVADGKWRIFLQTSYGPSRATDPTSNTLASFCSYYVPGEYDTQAEAVDAARALVAQLGVVG